jgi:hypothetical protein
VRSENKTTIVLFYFQEPAGERTIERHNVYELILSAPFLCKLSKIKIIRKTQQIVVFLTFYFKTLCRLRKLSVVG